MVNISPSIAGFIKGLGIVLLVSTLSFLGDVSHFTGIVNPIVATMIAALASSLESHMKAASGNTTALFGSVRIS